MRRMCSTGFIASRMDVLHRAMRVRLRAMAEALGVPAESIWSS